MLNKVILMGRLTADPELRQTPSGVSSCRFSVAVNRNYTSKETGERQTDFINVVAWRNTAEFVSRYFSKGKMIIVEGSLRNNNYTDQTALSITLWTFRQIMFRLVKANLQARQTAASESAEVISSSRISNSRFSSSRLTNLFHWEI